MTLNQSGGFTLVDGFYYLTCPWCGATIQVAQNEINCRMFICGVYKNSMKPVHQHMNAEEARRLKESGQVNGCMNPFFFDGTVVKKRSYG